MTVHEWLDERSGDVPPPLAERLFTIVGPDLQADAGRAPEILAAAAERTLRSVVFGGDTSRTVARDLLAADALVTYACQAAAERVLTDAATRQSADEQNAELASWCDELVERFAHLLSGGEA